MLPISTLSSYRRLVKAYISASLPAYMVFFITARCNARCSHCFYWQKVDTASKDSELSLEEIEKIAKSVQGLVQISLTGGEPFLREDLAEIIKVFYRFSGTRFFTISTNGSLTSATEKVLEDVLGKTPRAFYRISISMDDIGKGYDEKRRISGLSNKIRDTVGMLNELKKDYPQVAVSMATTMDKDNQDRIGQIYEYIKENFKLDDWGVGVIRGCPKDGLLKDIDTARYDAIFDTLKNSFKSRSWLTRQLRRILLYEHPLKIRIIREKRQVIPCLAGKRMVVLRENGDAEPCEMLGHFLGKGSIMGNVRDLDYSLRDLVLDRRSQDIRRFIATGACHCTYECALHCSIFYNPAEMIKAFIKHPVI